MSLSTQERTIIMTTSPETERRLRYLASERGGWLRIDTPGTAYSIIAAKDGAVLVGPSASLATIESYVAARIDPTIVNAV
jgi:hypothetical protein